MSLLVRVSAFPDPKEALVAAGYLRAQGLPVLVRNDAHIGVNPALRVALGGYDLMTPAACAGEARDALDVVLSGALALDRDPVPRPRKSWAWLPAYLLVGGTAFVPLAHRGPIRWIEAALLLLVYLCGLGRFYVDFIHGG